MRLTSCVVGLGIALMAFCGSLIARHIGVSQWLMAGFAIGIVVCTGMPTLELRNRLTKLEEASRKEPR